MSAPRFDAVHGKVNPDLYPKTADEPAQARRTA